MVNLQNFKNIDLKNIDVSKALAAVTGKKELLAQVVIILASAIVGIVLVKNYFSQRTNYEQEAQTLNEKLAAIKSHEQSVKEVRQFVAGLPKALEEDRLSSQIQEYAAQSHVTILSFLPAEKVSHALSETLTVEISIQAQTYKDFLTFLKTIEKSLFSLRLDSCSLSVAKGKKPGVHQFEAQMQLTLVSIKI